MLHQRAHDRAVLREIGERACGHRTPRAGRGDLQHRGADSQAPADPRIFDESGFVGTSQNVRAEPADVDHRVGRERLERGQ